MFSLERHLLYRVDPMADSYEVNDTVENMTAETFVTKMQSYGMDSTERYVQKTADKYGVDLIVETPHYGVEPTCRLLCCALPLLNLVVHVCMTAKLMIKFWYLA